ncbi:hypothetical protein CPT_Silvanus_051 [Stenotrophomonas phage Silvanus]|nr:hypothetical protein CPT_Silvanus_051 [Stenotrophomonas phage Silvanus]
MNINNFQHFRILPPNSNTAVIVQRVDANHLTLQREGEDRKDRIDQVSLQQLLGNGWRVINVYALVSVPKTETININLNVDDILSEVEDRIGRAVAKGEATLAAAMSNHFAVSADTCKLQQGEAVSFKMQPEISAVLIDINGSVSAIHTVTGPDVATLDAARKVIRQDGSTWERKAPGERWDRSSKRGRGMLCTTEHLVGLTRDETVVVNMFPINEYRAHLEKVIEDAQQNKEKLIAQYKDAQREVERIKDETADCSTRIITTRKVLEGLGQ